MDFANVLFHILLSVLNFAKPKCRDSQFANDPTAKPFLRLPFRPSAAIWHAPKTHPRQVHRKMGVFLASGMRGEGSGRGRPSVRHFRTHPTFHRSSWLLLSPPTSSLALTLSSSACRARSPTRTPVRTSRAARVAKRTISHDTTAAETARPGATRRARRFRRSRADIHPPPVAFPGPLPRARTSRPRATSRCVPSSCAFFEIFGDAGSRKKTRRPLRAGCRARSSRARAPAAARAAGHRPGTWAHALVAFPERSDARSPSPAPPPVGSNAPSRRRRATRTSGASAVFEPRTRRVGAFCHKSPCGVLVFFCFRNDRSIDAYVTSSLTY